MAINRDQSSLLSHFSGRVGNLVLKRYTDKTVLSALPDMSKRKLSPMQKESNELMKMANIYAKSMIADPATKAAFAKKMNIPLNKVFRALVTDFMVNKGEESKLVSL